MNLRGHPAWAPVLVVVMALLAVAGATQPVQAHGGGTPQLVNAEAGPYWVSVWTQPDPLRAGDMHVSVAVSEAPRPGAPEGSAGDLVLDARVHVQVQPMRGSGPTLTAEATHEDAVNKLFYEADLDLPGDGYWEVVISVEGPLGAGSASFDVEALPQSTFNTVLGSRWPVWIGLGLIVAAAAWLALGFRSGNPQHLQSATGRYGNTNDAEDKKQPLAR